MINKSPEIIKNMFDKIAKNYDFNNNLISLGLHNLIKKKCVNALNIKKTDKIIDLCTGTGDIAGLIHSKNLDASVIGVDFSKNMLEIAQKKHPTIEFIQADCLNLPFEDNSFDICFISFGLRNIENFEKALEEIKRILKPNGFFIHLDFSGNKFIINSLFNLIIPIVIHSDAYEYLIKSKELFFNSERLINLFETKGFKFVKKQDYLFKMISMQIMKN